MPEKPKVKEYSNGAITIIWQPGLCIHAERCFKGLPAVFDPSVRPWVNPQGANTDRIVAQVMECPSGALSYRMENDNSSSPEQAQASTSIEVATDGPLLISGPISLSGQHGEQQIDKPKVALCRCGYSSNKPFCDGSHKRQGWQAQ